MAEFEYNRSVNKTTGLSPFEIITGFKPKQANDLVLIARHHFRYQTLHLHLHLIYMHYMKKSET